MVRSATIDDVPAVARVHVDAWRSSYTKLLPSTFLENLRYEEREKLWRELIGANDIRRVIVAVDDDSGAVVGFAACGPNRTANPRFPGELYAIYLLAEHRGKGIGRVLFDAIVGYLREQALLPFQIWILAGDDDIDRFYRALGGRRVASQPTTIGGTDLYETAWGFVLPE